jgi:hypothetical protein
MLVGDPPSPGGRRATAEGRPYGVPRKSLDEEVGTVFVVELRSEVYGNEPFTYPTLEEAVAGGRRLLCASKKAYVKDWVPREVVLVLGTIGGDEDSESE